MPRIQRDPTLDEMPDFESEEFTASFTALATAENTLEIIIQRAKDAWTAGHRKKVEEWERQVEADKEEERLLEEQQERDAEENRKALEELELQQKAEKDKKRPKVKDFAPQSRSAHTPLHAPHNSRSTRSSSSSTASFGTSLHRAARKPNSPTGRHHHRRSPSPRARQA